MGGADSTKERLRRRGKQLGSRARGSKTPRVEEPLVPTSMGRRTRGARAGERGGQRLCRRTEEALDLLQDLPLRPKVGSRIFCFKFGSSNQDNISASLTTLIGQGYLKVFFQGTIILNQDSIYNNDNLNHLLTPS